MPESPADFHRLDSRLRLSGELIARTGLHIGSGAVEHDAMDMPVLRDAEGFPFVREYAPVSNRPTPQV